MARKLKGQEQILSGSPSGSFTNFSFKPIEANRAPTTADTGYEIGQIWVNPSSNLVYVLSGVSAGTATWNLTGPTASDIDTLTGDSGGPLSPTGGNINILGGSGVSVGGSGSTLTISLTGAGTAIDSFSPDAGTDPVVPTAAGVVTMAGTSNQITTTGGANTLTFSVPSAFIGPGSIESTTSLVVGTTVTATGGASSFGGGTFTVASGTNAINISADAAATTVNIGTGGAAKTLTIGSSNTSSATTITAGSGGVNVDGITLINDSVNSNTSINTGTSTGTVSIGNSAAGAITADTAAGISFDAATASNFTVTGATQDLTLASVGGSVKINSTENAAGAIALSANGGTSETITITSAQGTGAGSVTLDSTAGGITLSAALATADAINLAASAGGVDIDGALQVNIASSQNAADAIRINASAGGIDIDAAGGAAEDISIVNAAGSIFIQGGEDDAACVLIEADGGTSERVHLHSDQGTGNDSIFLESDVGGVTLTSGKADAAALDFNAASGGCTIDCGLGISLDAAGASNFTTSGAGIDIDIASGAGRVIVTAGEDAADAIYLHADAGTGEKIRIHADQGTGADSVELESDVGGITLTSGLASTDAINLAASAGGVDIDGALEVNITSSEAAVADAVTISASAADGGITLDSGATPGVTFTNGTQSHQMLVGSGSPNGSVTAAQGSLYVDVAGSTSTTILFVNTDGGTTWVGVGA